LSTPALAQPSVVAADADAADGLVTDFDRVAAAERNYLGKLPLAEHVLAGLGGIAPFQRGAAERTRRVGLAPRQFDAVRGRIVRRDEDAHPPGAVDDGDRDGNVALLASVDGALSDLQAQLPGDVALHLQPPSALAASGTGKPRRRRRPNHEST
jgi:hypothetical protein